MHTMISIWCIKFKLYVINVPTCITCWCFKDRYNKVDPVVEVR